MLKWLWHIETLWQLQVIRSAFSTASVLLCLFFLPTCCFPSACSLQLFPRWQLCQFCKWRKMWVSKTMTIYYSDIVTCMSTWVWTTTWNSRVWQVHMATPISADVLVVLWWELIHVCCCKPISRTACVMLRSTTNHNKHFRRQQTQVFAYWKLTRIWSMLAVD